MSIINRFPQGLLGLLQSKTTGRSPQEIDPRTQLTIEGLPFYLASVQLSVARTDQAFATRGEQIARVPVPATETWLVIGVSSRAIAGSGGDSVSITPAITNAPGGGTNISVPIGDMGKGFFFTMAASGDGYAVTYTPPIPLIVRAPVEFCTIVTREANIGTPILRTEVLYYQLD